MGSWFSNLHIRKNGKLSEKDIAVSIGNIMASNNYELLSSQDGADGAFAIITDDKSQWYSVYSDLFSFDTPKLFADFANPMLAELKTQALGIACFDSDYLYLNLIDSTGKVDAFAGVGSASGLGIRKRTNLKKWKNEVDDYTTFAESIGQDYVCTEDVLAQIERCICLPCEYAQSAYEYLDDMGISKSATRLYFKLQGEAKEELPRFKHGQYALKPPFIGHPCVVNVNNVGGASKGLSVYFIGPYVENEEITFSDVSFVIRKNNCSEFVPIELKKVKLTNGQWAYYYHDAEYKILPKADDRLPPSKRERIRSERSISVRFVPQGNPRKILDITVVIVPDKNPEGQAGWNVWHPYGSKKACIEDWNKFCTRLGDGDNQLREEDFD